MDMGGCIWVVPSAAAVTMHLVRMLGMLLHAFCHARLCNNLMAVVAHAIFIVMMVRMSTRTGAVSVVFMVLLIHFHDSLTPLL